MLFEIGENIRKERKRQKISQGSLAKTLGMSRSTIRQIESGIVTGVQTCALRSTFIVTLYWTLSAPQ